MTRINTNPLLFGAVDRLNHSKWAKGAVDTMEKPSALTVLFFLSAFVLPVSLIPASSGILIELPLLPAAWWTDYLVIVFTGSAVLFRAVGFHRRPKSATLRWFALPFMAATAWQVVTSFWNGQDSFVRSYALLQSVMMGAAVWGAVLTCSGLTLSTRVRFLSGLTVLVAFILSIYVGLSFVFPSLRPSDEWMDRTLAGLDFIRVFGPLGKSTTLNFLILPALGFALGKVFMKSRATPLWLLIALFFVVCVIFTGSRGGLISLVTFGAVLLVWGRLRAAVVIIPAVLLVTSAFALIGLPERFRALQDNARFTTYQTALRTYVSNPRNVFVGTGHGALYTKLHDDSVRRMLGRNRWYLFDHRTEYGYSLRNSHSAILRSLVETGVPGLLLILTPLLWLLFRPLSPAFRTAPQPERMLLRSSLAGCVSVMPFFFFEEFFISAVWIVVLWCIYAVCAAEGVERT